METLIVICTIVGTIAAIISAVAALFYCEEWYHKKFPKAEEGQMNASKGHLPLANILLRAATILAVISSAGFMASGCVWLTKIQIQVTETQKNAQISAQVITPLLTNLDNETELANKELDIIKSQQSSTNTGLEEWLLMATPIQVTNTSHILDDPSKTVTTGSLPTSMMNASFEDGLDMMFIVHVSNAGPPTTAWQWSAYMVLPDGTQIPGVILAVQVSTNLVPLVENGYGAYRPIPSEYLVDELGFKALQTGEGRNGWFVLHFNGVEKGKVEDGTRFYIQCLDSYKKTFTIPDIWTNPKRSQEEE